MYKGKIVPCQVMTEAYQSGIPAVLGCKSRLEAGQTNKPETQLQLSEGYCTSWTSGYGWDTDCNALDAKNASWKCLWIHDTSFNDSGTKDISRVGLKTWNLT